MRRTAGIVAMGLCAMLLTAGCTATITSVATVDADGRVDGLVEIALSGDAAAASDPADLDAAFTRFGLTPERAVRDGVLLRTAELTEPWGHYSQVSGVASVAADPAERTITVSLTEPTTLTDAYRAAVADEPDGAALAGALAASTTLTVRVVAPAPIVAATFTPSGVGGDEVVAGAEPVATLDGATLEVRNFADRAMPGDVTITYADPGGAGVLPGPAAALLAAGAALAAASIIVVLRRR